MDFLFSVDHCLHEWHPSEQTHTYLSTRTFISTQYTCRAWGVLQNDLLRNMLSSILIISGKTRWRFPLHCCACFSISFHLIFWITVLQGIQRHSHFILIDKKNCCDVQQYKIPFNINMAFFFSEIRTGGGLRLKYYQCCKLEKLKRLVYQTRARNEIFGSFHIMRLKLSSCLYLCDRLSHESTRSNLIRTPEMSLSLWMY